MSESNAKSVHSIVASAHLDAVRRQGYKQPYETDIRHHYTNYRPGARITMSRRDKAYGLPAALHTTP